MPTIHLHLHRRAARDAGESVEERRRALTGGITVRPAGPSVAARREAITGRYDPVAVNKAIASSRQKIGGKEARAIHSVLRGWRGDTKGRDDFDPSVAKRRGESYAKLHSQWNRAMNARTASKDPKERASLMTQISALEHAMGAESAALQRGKTGDSFLITVKNPSPKPMYPTSQYRVHAATEAEARKKWDLHHNQTPILKIVQDRKVRDVTNAQLREVAEYHGVTYRFLVDLERTDPEEFRDMVEEARRGHGRDARRTGDRARFKTRDCPGCGGTCGGHDAGGRQVTTSNAKGQKVKVYLPSKEEEQARARAHTERQKPSAAVRAALRQPVDGQRRAKDAPQHGREATGKVQAGWPESVRYKGKQWFRSDGRGVGRIMRTGAPSKTYVFWQEGMREDDEVAVDRDGNLYDDFA